MFIEATLAIDPSQVTEIAKTKPTKAFARLAHALTGGSFSSNEQRETFTAVAILQQLNVVLRSCGIDDILRLTKDDVIIYEERHGEKDDLKIAVDEFVRTAASNEVDSHIEDLG